MAAAGTRGHRPAPRGLRARGLARGSAARPGDSRAGAETWAAPVLRAPRVSAPPLLPLGPRVSNLPQMTMTA